MDKNILFESKYITGVDNLKDELDKRLSLIEVSFDIDVSAYKNSFDNLLNTANETSKIVGANNIHTLIEPPIRNVYGVNTAYVLRTYMNILH